MGVSLQFCDGSMTATLRRESDFVSAFVMRRNGVPAIVGCVFAGVYERYAEAFTSGKSRAIRGKAQDPAQWYRARPSSYLARRASRHRNPRSTKSLDENIGMKCSLDESS